MQQRDRRWPGPEGDGCRYYSCAGYHRGGKTVCKLTNVPGPALEEFVLRVLERVLLAEHETTKKAIDAFVDGVLRPAKSSRERNGSKPVLDLLNRKIKATLSMLAGPSFDGLEELRITLADLNAKRDALQKKQAPVEREQPVLPSKDALHNWAMNQYVQLNELLTNRSSELEDRQVVEAYIDRIEVAPLDKAGTIYIKADLESACASTHGPIRERRGRQEVTRR